VAAAIVKTAKAHTGVSTDAAFGRLPSLVITGDTMRLGKSGFALAMRRRDSVVYPSNGLNGQLVI